MKNNMFDKQEEVSIMKEKIAQYRLIISGLGEDDGLTSFSYKKNIAELEHKIAILNDESITVAEAYMMRFGDE